MFRRLSGVLGLLCLGASAGLLPAVDDPPKAPPAFNPEAAFQRGDLNKDGKLSKDEFTKLMQQIAPRLKDNPQNIEPLFRRLDADGDGFLTLEEYSKIAALRRPMQPPEEKAKAPVAPGAGAFGPPSAEEVTFFEKKIRPVLVQSCYKCHSAETEKVKGGLVLDTRDGIRKGGDSGPAVVPGDMNSLLLKAMRHQGDLKMPAKKLADEVVADFERWVRMGAPDPRDGTTRVARQEIDIDKGRQFWAFQAPRKTTPPAVKDTSWARGDLDRFVLAGLEAKGLKPVADADAHTLIRRLHFDLIGLPPTPEEVEAFVAGYRKQPRQALESAVNRLLESPHFGERWGRHWLDVARYAESSGMATNINHPHAWRYRDYVIAAFNSDKPYDRFLKEQLAGDLLPTGTDREKVDHIIATGFLALGPKQHNERNPQQFQMDLADEQINVTFQVFQGLTVACARCHDHKFDPIPQKDYYALSGIFRSSETCYGTVRLIQNNHPSPLIELPAGANAAVAVEPITKEARARIEKQRDDARKTIQELPPQDRISMRAIRLRVEAQQADARLAGVDSDGKPRVVAMGVRERYFPADSKLYVRGELDKPAEVVPRGFPQVLTTKQPSIKQGSGRRELAEWLASRDNPLTARVMVNRVWLHLLGRGLVATPDNFGASGQLPSNQALLDHLAFSFMEDGWSVKKMIREIVLSRVYQLGSNRDPACYEIDPDNALTWRQTRRRLDAEAVRDAMLAVSGRLETEDPPVGSVVARAGEGFSGFARFLLNETGRDRHRAVYLPVMRDQLPEALALFDFAEPSLVIGERATTTVPAQALFLLNNPFVLSQAEVVAERLLTQEGTDAERIRRAYPLFFGRPATDREVEQAQQFLGHYVKTLGAAPGKATERTAWTMLCQALFASADFLYRN